MSEATLLLRLAGPTQGWHVHRGVGFGRPPSLPPVHTMVPSWTGVMGLLAAAQGRPRGSYLADMADLEVLVRTDQPGVPRREFKVTRRRNPAGALVRHARREAVLDDGCFLVGVGGPRTQLEALFDALGRPVFALCLGQRAYPVTLPVRLALVDEDLEVAVRGWPWLAHESHERRREGGRWALPLTRVSAGGFDSWSRIRLPSVWVGSGAVGGSWSPDWLAVL